MPLNQNIHSILIQHSLDVIIICNAENEIVEFNPAAENLFGYNKDEILGQPVQIIYESEEEFKVVSKKLSSSGKYEGRVLNKCKNGELKIARLSASLVKDEQGIVVGSLGISKDITKEIEKEKEFENIVENALDIIYTSDYKGVFQYFNPSVEKIIGYKAAELIGKSFLDIVDPAFTKAVEQHYRDVFDNKLIDSYFEFKVLHKEGHSLWVGQQVRTELNQLDNSKIQRFYGVVRDINLRKETEMKLQESEASYRELFDNSSDMIQSVEPDGNFLFVNESWREAMGYTEEELNKLNLFDVLHNNSLDHCKNLLNEIAISKNSPEEKVVYSLMNKDGEEVIVEGSMTVSLEGDEVKSVQTFLRDVTEAKKAEAIIASQNKSIRESIQYAKSIQDSVLPNEDEIADIFDDYFVLFNPKDILSGDFYIVDKIKSNAGVVFPVLIVADCTGHGVPGGVLSLLCNGLLKESFTRYDINSPGESLDYVRTKLINLFRSDKKGYVNDGMDVSFCVFDLENRRLNFSAANRSCVVLRNGELIETKGNRQHVGFTDRPEPFANHLIELEKGDIVVLHTDGYADQFGGPHKRKFMKKRFYELLKELSDKDLFQIKQKLEEELAEWKGDMEQTDDITVFAVRVS
ncbi:PAS domain S-box protein [Paracrocinitomix mangrovi]|uniref:PAS domain S-box protein n=1 Tax=Paracrocinitomix mangrovi TaxID=2862509 RepID=UPI001C8E14F3|nr:PAS domain S-box protein [Paracrocinitomix mangrovi]UKN01211.1 PAS domain S-box protein [Paracrocinitomix mangrovi]